MDDGRLDALGQTIVGALSGAATGHSVAFNQLTVDVEVARIVDVVRYLRDDPACRFVNLTDVTAVDYPGREKRFDVVYHLLLPDYCEMMVVVFGDEIQMVCESHRRLQTRVGNGPSK